MTKRRRTKQVRIGNVAVGGNAPVSVQSMTSTDTRNVTATVRQLKRLEKAGCQIARVAVPDTEAARAIKSIKKGVTIPLVADIHFNYRLALQSIENGADAVRLNPGNITEKAQIKEVARLAGKHKIPIRVGVNSGSLPGRPKTENQKARLMVHSALKYIRILEGFGFYDIIVSLKAENVLTTIRAYREMAGLCPYPFHLGVTAAGLPEEAVIKSAVGIGSLLSEGIGDTLRVSLTGPPEAEVRAGYEILNSLGLFRKNLEIISCPTCGRCEIDLVKIVKEVKKTLSPLTSHLSPLKLAVMGCVVNGPGEAREADIGIAGGKGVGILFKKGKKIKTVKEKDLVRELCNELQITNYKLRIEGKNNS